MTCPDVQDDPALTQSGAHSVPVVLPSGTILKSNGFNGWLLRCREKSNKKKSVAFYLYPALDTE